MVLTSVTVTPMDSGAVRRMAMQALLAKPHKEYKVAYHRAKVGEEVHFVPAYAAKRPAAKRVLQGTHFEPATHALVAALMAERPGSMVHAGTFFGDMLPSFAKACRGRLYAFEPVLENFILAKLCVEANGLDNVLLTNAGLGEAIAVAHIDTGETGDHRGGSSAIAERGQPTMLTTIDSFAIDDLTIIQLDVEGHELEALNGARRTLKANAPFVLIEDNKRACAEMLQDLGYRRAGRLPGIIAWARPDHLTLLRDMIQAQRAELEAQRAASPSEAQ